MSVIDTQNTAVDCVKFHAVERQAEALAVQEKDLAQREASLQNEQEQLRQQRALLEESCTSIEKERLEARDMLKVAPKPCLLNALSTRGNV